MKVCSNLEKLAKSFDKCGHKLYIVGGYVRDSLMGLDSKDIDICSSMPYIEVEKICKDLKLSCHPVNPKLGTLLIKDKEEQFEYTQFRKENYDNTGKHTPDKIEFVSDIRLDFLRRDFTINSLYYDIVNKEIIDLGHCQKNLNSRIIRTTNLPTTTFQQDALRILRLIRFACTYNLDIERNTLKSAKAMTSGLKNISKERITTEIQKMVVADLKHNNNNMHFIKLLNELKLLPYLFNYSLTRIKQISKADKINFYKIGLQGRLIGFYILIIKSYINHQVSDTQLSFIINMLLGKDGLKESSSNIKLTEKIYRVFQNLTIEKNSLIATINYLTLSDCERDIINCYIAKKSKTTLDNNIHYIESKGIPLNVNSLQVSATDLIENGINSKFVSKILSTLYNLVIEMKIENSKDALLSSAIEIHGKFITLMEKEK